MRGGRGGQRPGRLPLRTDAWVVGLRMEAAEHDGDLLLRLLEIGFLPGERVRVVARAFPVGDPVAVRVGRSTFALRRRRPRWWHQHHALRRPPHGAAAAAPCAWPCWATPTAARRRCSTC